MLFSLRIHASMLDYKQKSNLKETLIMELQNFINRTTQDGILGVKITQNGEDIGKRLWDEECRRNVYSVSKSFTSAAVGIAIKEGLLALEETLADAFAEDMPEDQSHYGAGGAHAGKSGRISLTGNGERFAYHVSGTGNTGADGGTAAFVQGTGLGENVAGPSFHLPARDKVRIQ